MWITEKEMREIEEVFCVNGGWTREGLSYLGLSTPLKSGWKSRLMEDGVDDGAPFSRGIPPEDWKYLEGYPDKEENIAHDMFAKTNPHKYVMLQLNTLENIVNDLRKQIDQTKSTIQELRSMVSEDEF